MRLLKITTTLIVLTLLSTLANAEPNSLELSGIFKLESINFKDVADSTVFLTIIDGTKVLVGSAHTLTEEGVITRARVQYNGSYYELNLVNTLVHQNFIKSVDRSFDYAIYSIPNAFSGVTNEIRPIPLKSIPLTVDELSTYKQFKLYGYPEGNPKSVTLTPNHAVGMETIATSSENVILINPNPLGHGYSGGPLVGMNANGKWEVIGTVSGYDGLSEGAVLSPTSQTHLNPNDNGLLIPFCHSHEQT